MDFAPNAEERSNQMRNTVMIVQSYMWTKWRSQDGGMGLCVFNVCSLFVNMHVAGAARASLRFQYTLWTCHQRENILLTTTTMTISCHFQPGHAWNTLPETSMEVEHQPLWKKIRPLQGGFAVGGTNHSTHYSPCLARGFDSSTRLAMFLAPIFPQRAEQSKLQWS